ncbi:hypothetical protein ACWERV_23050 [Streptomyces sp. NPDC004031]
MSTVHSRVDVSPLQRTGHPVQSAGAWALAVMADREEPEHVTGADLDRLCERILTDACTAGASTDPESPAYAWWKVLAALYPNSKVTHNRRQRDPAVLRAELAPSFAPDDSVSGEAWPCTYCHTPTTHLWGKTMLPGVDSARFLNNLPGWLAGWPVCRACRLSVWALPYGAWATAGSVTALTAERPEVERAFAAANVRRAERIMRSGFGGPVPRGGAHLRAVRSAEDVTGLCGLTLYEMRNDNQDPWVVIHRARRSVTVFLASIRGNAPLRRAWQLLEIGLGDTGGGPQEAAYLLFEREGEAWTLLGAMHQLLADFDRWSPAHRELLTRLAFDFAGTVY